MGITTLQHSVFLHALGIAILNSLWQGFILWFIYETINIFYKGSTSAFRNKLSTVLIFISFGWFITSFISGIFVDEKLLSDISSSATSITLSAPIEAKNFTLHYLSSFASVVLPYLSVSYIFLLIFLMAKLFSAYRHVYFIANKKLIAPPVALQEFASKVAAQILIIKKVSVWISEYIDVPATIGFIKPVILIPVASINNLSSQQLEAIILHELSHIKRNDYLINLFISVIETILFFNPFILLLSKIIKRERENCCDDFVIHYRYDPHSYASALLRLEQSRKSNLQLSVGAVSGKKQLLTRIQRITNTQVAPRQFNYGQKLCALLVITGIICSVAWLSPQQKSKSVNKTIIRNKEKAGSTSSPIQFKKSTPIGIESSPATAAHENINKGSQKQELVTLSDDAPDIAMHDDNKIANTESGDFKNATEKIVDDQVFQNQKLFSINKIKIAPFKALLNFTFPNPKSNKNVTELNKNLLKAYKEIYKLDWNKIENNINESMSNIDINQILKMEREELRNEKMKRSGVFKRLRTQRSNSESSTGGEEDMLLKDQQTTGLDVANEGHYKNAHSWSNDENNPNISYGSGTYNYVYVPKAGSTNKATASLQLKKTPKAITVKGLNNKSARVIIEHLTQAFNDGKASFNFTSPLYINKKTTPETKSDIIRIEINEIP